MVYFGWRETPSQYFVQFLGDACCGFVEGDGRSTDPFNSLVGCVKKLPEGSLVCIGYNPEKKKKKEEEERKRQQ